MCPCSLLLFVHIWKYFNSYTRCCFQRLVYKIWIKMGKYWVNLMTPCTCPGVHMHQTPDIHCQHLMHLTELIFIHLVYIISQLWLENISGFTPLLACSDAAFMNCHSPCSYLPQSVLCSVRNSICSPLPLSLVSCREQEAHVTVLGKHSFPLKKYHELQFH